MKPAEGHPFVSYEAVTFRVEAHRGGTYILVQPRAIYFVGTIEELEDYVETLIDRLKNVKEWARDRAEEEGDP